MATVSILPSGSWNYTRETSTIAVSASGSTVHFNMGDKLTNEMANAKAYIPINMSNYKTITMKYSSRTGDGISSISFGVFSSTSAGSSSGTGVKDITTTSSGTITIDVSGLSGTYYVGFLFYGNTYTFNEYVGWSAQQRVIISSLTGIESNFTITAKAGTGISSVSPATQSVQSGSYSQAITATVSNGYHWGSWSDGTTSNPYPSFLVTAAKTITANATGNTYYVRYNKNGSYVGKTDEDVGGTMSNSTCIYGTAKNLTAIAYSLTGYSFNGWNTKSNGTGTNYADKASVSTLTTTSGATVNLYAKWTANTYTVAYNANGGSGTMSNTTHTYDSAKSLTKNAFTKEGYMFMGWSTSRSGDVEYIDEESVKNLATSGTITLYAVWMREGTIRIMVNGEYKMAQVYVYSGGWKLTQPYCYSSAWKLCGG